MKRIAAVTIAFLLIASMLGCGRGLDVINQLTNKEEQATEAPTATPAETPIEIQADVSTEAPTENPTTEPETPPESDYNFRNTYWGMTQSEVEQAEAEEAVGKDDEWLFYHSDDIAGLSATIGYSFENGKLTGGMYMFDAAYDNGDAYIEDFSDIKEKLTEKYGDPGTDALLWSDDQWKDDPQNYGTALAAGHLSYIATWEAETTEVTLYMSGKDNEVSLTLIYDQIEGGDDSNDNGL